MPTLPQRRLIAAVCRVIGVALIVIAAAGAVAGRGVASTALNLAAGFAAGTIASLYLRSTARPGAYGPLHSLLVAAVHRFTPSLQPMSAADRSVWASARTLRDVGDLVAKWVAGELKSQASYGGPCDVDEDDAPGLAEALIMLNRAGFVTNSSQAGTDEVDGDKVHWQCYAAVVGFGTAETRKWLTEAVSMCDGLVLESCHPQRTFDWRPIVPVTFGNGEIFTDFGRWIDADDIHDTWSGYGICRRNARDELIAADQFVIRDTEFGRNDRLWVTLAIAAKQHQLRG